MKKHPALPLFIASLLLAAPAVGAVKKWNQKMQGLGETFSELLPDLVESSPTDAKARVRLEKGAKRLSTLAHAIAMPANAVAPDADPTLPYVAARFDKEVRRASHAMQNGNY